MKTIEVVSERLTRSDQRVLADFARAEDGTCRMGRGQGAHFMKLMNRGLIEDAGTVTVRERFHGYLQTVTIRVYRLTLHGRGVAAAAEAYLSSMRSAR